MTIQFGLSAPFRGPLARPEPLRRIAEAADRLGYGALTVSDHLVVPRQVAPNYPYSESGEFAWTADGSTDCMEQFTLLAWLAAATTQVKLLTSVIVVPHRNPVFMAKSLATTDVLSGGRVIAGIGAGWMREEFEALNLPDFDARGRVTDEYLRVMKSCWTDERANFNGEFFRIADAAADPKPVQSPHPPIWVGGESGPALRRTVALGDGWYPFGTNPRFRMDTVAAFAARRDRLFAMAEEAGRDPSTIALAYNCPFHAETAATGADGRRRPFTGSPEQRAADISEWAAAGVGTLMVNVMATELEPMLERMEAFATEVMPLIGG
ncbi:MAG: LLM class F420-dependent oxidoreductase [Acidimicrobiia bacterium]|nr:LLM class F420-dependent oxidoreductase [Acidimicrobiia bacterium]